MKKPAYILMAFLLIFGMLQISIPLNEMGVKGAKPDDGIDGLQYVDGDWIVTGPESYTHEIIVLSGNLTIEDGGSLTLRNVTLAINCTTSDDQYEINVYSGGSLIITDFDGDPSTLDDNSNLTDSPFDPNETWGDDDYEFTVRVYNGAYFSLTNSRIRECDIIQIQADNCEIQNCTFINNNYPIMIMSGENNKIAYNYIDNSSTGINVQWTTNNTHIYNNDILNNKFGIFLIGRGVGVYTNNTIIHDNEIYDNDAGIYSEYEIDNGRIYNNDLYNNNMWAIELKGENSWVHNNEIHHNMHAMNVVGDNVTVNNNIIHNNTENGLHLTNLENSNIYKNIIEYNGGDDWKHNLRVQLCDNLDIHDNTIQRVRPGTNHAVMMTDNSNITFHHNTVVYNENSGSTVRCDLRNFSSMFDTNIKFFNNNISNNNGTGLHIWDQSTYDNYVEIKNNVIYNNRQYSLDLFAVRAYSITNNTMISNVVPSYGVFINDGGGGEFTNNTIGANNEHFVIRDSNGAPDDTYFEVTNCTCDPSNIWFMAENPTIFFTNFLHVKVTDLWGPAPNVFVEVKDNTGSTVYQGYTGYDGYIRWIKLINQTRTSVKTTYYDPHNITAISDGYLAYGEIEPTMDISQTVNVHFNVDLRPEPPSMLAATSDWTDVDLSWEPCHSPDLHHYLVFRNDTGSGWVEVYNSSLLPLPERTWPNWTDPMAASDWTTYYYKVQAIDNGGHYSDFSEIAFCGDWAVDDIRVYTDFTVQLNGSLIILPTGNLTFNHVELKFNNSYKAEFGIDVRAGGQLFILDNDDNPQTTFDQSNISVMDPDNEFYFIVSGSKFEMKNSRLSYCGSDSGLVFFSWNIDKFAPMVMTVGEPWTRGLYITDSALDVTIENNDLSNNFVSVLIDGGNSCTVTGNTFSYNTFGVYMHDANDNTVNDNIFLEHDAFPIYLFNSENNTIFSNNLTSDTDIGVALYDRGCKFNEIYLNKFINGDYGIYLYEAGDNNNISDNNFSELYYGIRIDYSHWNILWNNNYDNTSESVCHIEYSDYTTISHESLNYIEFGYYLMFSNNTMISNVNVENAMGYAFVLWICRDVQAANIFITSCTGGMGILGGNDNIFTNITVENCGTGVLCFGGPDWDLPSVEGIEFYNSRISNGIQEAFTLFFCDDFVVNNCTLNATGYNYNLTSSQVISMNTIYNQTKVKLNESSISLYWLLDVKVLDWLDNPVPNANVQIRKSLGTLVYNGSTDINGYVRWIWVHERTQYTRLNETSNPHFIIAQSGNHSGSKTILVNQSGEEIVYLENSLPSASNLIISPSYPTTIDDLTLTYQYSDPENDPEGNTMLNWYVDGVYNPAYDNLLVIDSAFTSKGQTWFCEVTPHDGSEYGITLPSIPVTIQNTKPVVTNVTIEETNPRSSDALHVNYIYSDIDGDLETWSLHRWYVDNGSGWVYSGVDSVELSPIYTKKGEKWKCNVTPGDGDDYGIPVESSYVIINNSAPEVSDLTIIPGSPKSNETLWASYNYYDPDDDPESGSMIQWFRNDEEQLDLSGSISVDPSKTAKDDKWHYIITPSDGEDFGDVKQSEPVFIENTPPQVSNIIIQPYNPSTEDDLTVSYEFFDADGDEEGFDTIVEWLRWSGIEFIHTGLKVRTLSSSYTSKGDIWICEITPHDNISHGNTVRCSNSVTIMNSKPIASNLYITPSIPTAKTELVADYDYSDLDNDPEAGTEIIWYVYDTAMPDLNNQLTVPENLLQKDQVWHFTVRPSDGFTFGDVVKSQDITIQNSPPSAQNLTINPNFPLGNNSLRVSYIYIDEDDDPEGDSEIKWYKNGLHQAFYDDDLEVESSATGKGELWYFTLKVSDGTDQSEVISSHYVVIENSEPLIYSITPLPGDIVLNETESREFYVDCEDPDGDILLYKWRLGKSTVSDDDYYLFSADYESAGDYTLNLTVQDIGQDSFSLYFQWEITVENVNRLPQIEGQQPIEKNIKMKEDTSKKFSISASDPDTEDNPQITWYFDDVIAQTGGVTFTYFAEGAAGEHVVKAVVDDGTDSIEYSWNLTVQAGESLPLGLTWDQWGIILEIFVIAGTGFLAFIGYRRLRKKKGALKVYMSEIDEISESEDLDSDEYDQKLNEMEAKINAEFMEGKIEDLHYLMLQEIIGSRRGDRRRATITKKFDKLPGGIEKDLDEMLKDGKISKEEYDGFMATISKTESLSPSEKEELSKMIEKWEAKDKDLLEEGSPTEKVELKKSEIDDNLNHESDGKDKKEKSDED